SFFLAIFQAKCWPCHGEKTRQAELDLRTAAGVMKGGESGAVIVSGKPEKSLLYERVRDGVMPPGKKERLSEAEVNIIRRWIESGARSESVAAKIVESTSAPVVTQHDVIPIMLRHCTVCHGK